VREQLFAAAARFLNGVPYAQMAVRVHALTFGTSPSARRRSSQADRHTGRVLGVVATQRPLV